VSDIDTAAADSLKVLDPERPIREADVHQFRPTSHFDQKLTSDWQVARLHLQLIQ
jgi:hypothetical protein